MKALHSKIGTQGFGLLETVISLGILSIGMMTMANMLLISAKTQNDIKVNSEIQTFFNRAQKIVEAQETCTASLSGNFLNNAIVMHDPLQTTQVIATEGSSLNNDDWSVQTPRLQNPVEFSGHANIYRASLVLEANKNMTRVMGTPIVHKNIADIYVEVIAGQIVKCYGSSDQMDLAKNNCQMLGGAWDAASAFGSQCTLPNSSTTLASATNTKEHDPSLFNEKSNHSSETEKNK